MTGFLAAVGVLVPFADPDLSYPLPRGADMRIAHPSRTHGPGCRAAVFSRDGAKLATMSDRTVLVRAWPGGRRLLDLHFPRITHTRGLLAFSPDGRFIVAGEAELSRLMVGDLLTGKDWRLETERSDAERFEVSHVAFVSNGLVRAFGERLNEKRDRPGVFEAVDFDPTREKTLARRELPGRPVAIAIDGSAAILKVGEELQRCDVTVGRFTGKAVKVPEGIKSVATDADARQIAVPSKSGEVTVVELETGKQLTRIKLPDICLKLDWFKASNEERTTCPVELSLSPDGEELTALEAYGADMPTLWRWRVADRKSLLPLTYRSLKTDLVSGFGPGRNAVTLVGVDGHVREFDRATGKRVGPFTRPLKIASSADGRWIATHDGERFKVHDTRTGIVVHEVACRTEFLGEFALSDDGTRVVYADKTLVVLDVKLGREVLNAVSPDDQCPIDPTASCRFAPGNNSVLVRGGREHLTAFARWDIDTGRRRWATTCCEFVIAPDGKRLIHNNGDRIHIDEFDTLKPIRELELPPKEEAVVAFVDHIRVSEHGRIYATPRHTHVDLFDAEFNHLRRIQVIPIRDERLWSDVREVVTGVVLSSDGRRAAVGKHTDVQGMSLGTELRVYEVATGEPLAYCDYQTGSRAPLCFTPNKRFLWTTDNWRKYDGVALRYDLKPPRLPVFNTRNLLPELSGENAALAELAAGRLAAPGMLTWLGEQLPPDAKPDSARVAKLVRDLSDREFKTREEATAALVAMGPGVAPAMREVVKAPASPEARRRAETVLSRLSGESAPGVLLRVRAVTAVAMIAEEGDSAARKLLESWAKGDPISPLTESARAALERLPK